MAGRNFISDEMGGRIQRSVAYTENIGAQNRPEKRRIVRQRRGGAAGANFALCTITSTGADDKQFNVDVKIGNPNDPTSGALPKGILFLNYATTNGVVVGAQLMAIFFPSTTEGIEFDCFPVETLMNLVALPDAGEE